MAVKITVWKTALPILTACITLSSWSTAVNWSINERTLGCWPWSPCRAVWRSASRPASVRPAWSGGCGGHGGGGRLREARAPTERDRGALSGSSSLTFAVTTSEHGRRSPCCLLAASAAATVMATPQRGIGTNGRHGDRLPPLPLIDGDEIGGLNDAGNTGILNRLAPRVGEAAAYK